MTIRKRVVSRNEPNVYFIVLSGDWCTFDMVDFLRHIIETVRCAYMQRHIIIMQVYAK